MTETATRRAPSITRSPVRTRSRRPRRTPATPFAGWQWSRRTVVLSALVLSVLTAAYLVFFTGVLGVRQIDVVGGSQLTQQAVVQQADITADTPLVSVDLDQIKDQVAALPQLESVRVERSWPHTIRITVTERAALASIMVDGQPWALDRHGVVFLPVAQLSDDGAPALITMELTADELASSAGREAIAVLSGLDEATRTLVASISAPTAATVTLHLTDGRTVVWGSATRMKDKLTMLPGVLAHAGTHFDISTPDAILIS